MPTRCAHRLGSPLALLVALIGCSDLQPLPEPERVHPPCADQNPLRNLYFGDLHVHSAFSFDAIAYDTRLGPTDGYRFARGEAVELPPYDEAGRGTRTTQLDRPLDFAAMTEHAEFLGETQICTTPGTVGYDSGTCQDFRKDVGSGATLFGFETAFENPERIEDVCGPQAERCRDAARSRWQQLRDAADDAYDWTSACSFSTLVGYEYTNTLQIANLHRNVIFRTNSVPELPLTFYEQPDPGGLLRELEQRCIASDPACDVLVIPHNSNLSNGNQYVPAYAAATPSDQAEQAQRRSDLEVVAEVFQHKGDAECRNGVDPAAPDDPLCDFEKLRPADDEVCGDEPGTAGMRLGGCVHRLDFLRNVLLEGLVEQARIGVNPYRLGFVGATDSHNGTPGNVSSIDFPGHVGLADDTPEERLGAGTVTHDGIINNPGGLIAVWAEQNTREALFDAIRHREVYATSGPRFTVRFFASWTYPADLCDRSDPLSIAYDEGVPMGSSLVADPAGAAPLFYVRAERDPGVAGQPGGLLQRIQIIKGWIDEEGERHSRVFEVAGDPDGGATVAATTCEPQGPGAESLCAVWSDPAFQPDELAFYYARVVENPSCRWSTRECNALGAAAPAICEDPAVVKFVQQRAWSSPIWYDR